MIYFRHINIYDYEFVNVEIITVLLKKNQE